MPDTYLPWFSGYWCAPFGWFSDGKLRRAGIHGFAAYHTIRQVCYGRGLKPPCEIDEAHIEPAALVRATGAGIGAMTRAFNLLLEAGLLSRTVTGQIRVLESTPLSPVARRQEAFRNRAKLQESPRHSNATVTLQSRDRNARTETETETETDQDHASHGATVETTAGDHREVLDLEAEAERKHPLTAERIKKPRKGWTPEAKQVRADWCERQGKPNNEDRVTMLAIQRRLADGYSVEELIAANVADKRRGLGYSQAQMMGWKGFDSLVATGQAILNDQRVARELDAAAGYTPATLQSQVAAAFGVDPEKVKVTE